MGISSIGFVVEEGESGHAGAYQSVPLRKGNRARGKRVALDRRYRLPEMYASPFGDRDQRGCLKARV